MLAHLLSFQEVSRKSTVILLKTKLKNQSLKPQTFVNHNKQYEHKVIYFLFYVLLSCKTTNVFGIMENNDLFLANSPIKIVASLCGHVVDTVSTSPLSHRALAHQTFCVVGCTWLFFPTLHIGFLLDAYLQTLASPAAFLIVVCSVIASQDQSSMHHK